MNRKTIISSLVIGAVVLALGVGAVIYRSASAATSAVADLARTRTSILPVDDLQGGRGFGGVGAEALAAALGISVDDLKAANQQAHEAALKQAVEKGLITQAQADELQSKGAAFPFGDRWGGWLAKNGIDYDALLADALGISVEKLQEAYQQAFNAQIDQAVTDGKLTQEQADLMKGRYALSNDATFKSAMQSAYQSAVAQAVTNGIITQAQADLILAQGDGMGLPGMGFPGKGFGGGFPGPRGPHGDRGGNPPADFPVPSAP